MNTAPSLDPTVSSTGIRLPIEACPVAAFVLSGDRIAGANPAALCLLGVTDAEGVSGRLIAELIVLGDPVSTELGSPMPDGAGTLWRHALVRPLVGGAVPVLVSRGEDWGGKGNEPHCRVLIAVPASPGSDVMLDVEAREESRGRIAGVFANLAHEMRTPLNAVIGFGEILLGEHFGPLATRYKDYARDIVGAGYHLLALVNGALDLGRVSAGPDALEERPVELRNSVTSAMAMLEPSAAEKSISLNVVDIAGMPLIYADETRIRQLFVNLIGNAIKYSPAGRSVAVRYRIADDGEIWIEVADGGVGMTRDEIAVAILPFGRTESAMRAGEAGTGLGLPICKAIVEAHGGRLVIDSIPRRGTTVSVVLPANRLVAAPGHGGLLNLL